MLENYNYNFALSLSESFQPASLPPLPTLTGTSVLFHHILQRMSQDVMTSSYTYNMKV